jgi:hypothetical protein
MQKYKPNEDKGRKKRGHARRKRSFKKRKREEEKVEAVRKHRLIVWAIG